MTQTGYANAIVGAMLSWLKGLAGWVLKLFNLSAGYSPLQFLANNWLKLLVFFLVAGVVIDLLVWLVRWRPHWVWFRKSRVIINDKNFFAQEKHMDDRDDWDFEPDRKQSGNRSRKPRRNWEDSEFVVPSAARRRREEMESRRAAHVKSMQMNRRSQDESADVFRDGLFNVNAKQKFSDKYEDEVFSVSNLPDPERNSKNRQAVHRGASRFGSVEKNRARRKR